MFSGIVKEIGSVKSIKTKNKIVTFEVEAKKILETLYVSDSVAINGVCTTVTGKKNNSFFVKLMPETIEVTTFGSLKKGDRLNLEDSLKVGDKISGHFVQGHVDTVVKVLEIEEKGDSRRIYLSCPKKILKYIKKKGSVTLDGVSLTVSTATKTRFSVDLIPYTLEETTLGDLRKGGKVNLEVDVLARYVLD